jgi:hypothetical protein
VRPLVAVEVEVGPKGLLCLPAVHVLPQVDLLVLDRPPESLDEHVVESPATAVHRDGNAALLQSAREGRRRELGSLVGVEDFRAGVGQRRIESIHAEVAGQRVGEPPRQHVAAVEIHDGREVEEAVLQGDVGDVAGPDLIRPRNRQIPQ